METLKKARRSMRRKFEKLRREIEGLLQEVPVNEDAVKVKIALFNSVCVKLAESDEAILERLRKDGAAEEVEDQENDDILEFETQAEIVRVKLDKLFSTTVSPVNESLNGGSASTETRTRNFKLQKVAIKKFTGELTDWLRFWSQFRHIHEDPLMSGSEKFWHLSEYLEEGTDAGTIASTYPQTDENYPQVIEALKRRYGNEDILLQVYIRELLNLVIANVTTKDKIPMKDLHLKLDGYLRAMKTLNLQKADPASWLFPLVESSLPEQTLYAWHRSSLSSYDGSNDDPPKTRLDLLMDFVAREVEISHNIDLTKSFTVEKKPERKLVASKLIHKQGKSQTKDSIPSLSTFHHGDSVVCGFCDYKGHVAKKCRNARKMSYEEKIRKCRAKGLCYQCAEEYRGGACNHKNLDCFICHGQHIPILCKDWKLKRKYDEPEAKRTRKEKDDVKSVSSHANFECTSEVSLPMFRVAIWNGKRRKEEVRGLADTGSQRSYILNSTAARLGLRSFGRERVVHSLFGGQQTRVISHRKYRVLLTSTEGSSEEVWLTLRGHNMLCGEIPRVSQTNPEIVEELRKRRVRLSDEEGPLKVEILIGADMYPFILSPEFIQLQSGAAAIKTKLGWAVIGQTRSSALEDSMAHECVVMSVADANIAKLWELEAIGIYDQHFQNADEEQTIIQNFERHIVRLEDGRYSVKLPWRIREKFLPPNREVAFGRLQNATKKLTDMNLFRSYQKILEDWETEGFIERVTTSGIEGQVHYVPHRPVVKSESLTTPVRPVFDASCRAGRSPSLNDLLLKGKNYVKLIPEILLRFREKPVAFVSDIRKAFQMIDVQEEDRDVMRFLWWKDERTREVVEYRHKRVMFGATCSPFILGAVLKLHLTSLPEEEKTLGMKLLDAFYVDNCVSSEQTREEYETFRESSVQIMKRAQMDLRMWLSNVDEFDDAMTHTISVLGLEWDRIKDELFLNLKAVTLPEKITKRTVLSTVQKIFDPVGFSCPATLPMKLILQKAWLQKLTWDEPLQEKEMTTNGIPNKEGWSLHTFGDACDDAYAAVVFLRIERPGNVTVHLTTAKARVAPIKIKRPSKKSTLKGGKVDVEVIERLSIPKLELLACLIGSKLATFVSKTWDLKDIPMYFWSDSTTALAWIKRSNQWGTFVSNRVTEIRKTTNSEQWHHVPGFENPADLPSRGCFPSKLLCTRWWKGPKWLYKAKSEWPLQVVEENEDEINTERRRTSMITIAGFCVVGKVRYEQSYLRLVRIIAWCRRFLLNTLAKSPQHRRNGELTETEVKKAEFVMVRNIQNDEYGDDPEKLLHGLEVFKDSWGILRVKTRLTYRADTESFKYPMILPGHRQEVRRLILDVHRKNCHAGVGMLMTILREEYWITKARKSIKSVLRRCFRCRKLAAKQCIPQSAPLPLDRIKDVDIFEILGVDLAGPLTLKNGKSVWIVIFTCAHYRAVHFELVSSISARAFIRALGRFVRKYRRPARIYADNGTNFRGTDNLMAKLDWDAIQKFFDVERIKFKFILALSPWYGGWWERLIRTAKDLLKRTVGTGVLNWTELESVMVSVAGVMNRRPLTYVSEDPRDLEPLTPAMFLHPFGSVQFPEEEMTESQKLRYRFKYVNTLKQELRDRFRKEYLSLLVNKNRKKATRCLKVGELVLVGSDNRKRMQWPLGKIQELIKGTDGIPRMARVKTATGEFVRPFQRLYPLEMDEENETRNNFQKLVLSTRSGREVKVPQRLNL